MFLDEVHLFLKAGDGGRGCVSFRREKFVPRGGPNGGDGGNGGSVIMRVSAHFGTLAHLYNRHHVNAGRGEHGRGSNQSGAAGADALVEVAPGTVVKEFDSGKVLADLVADGQEAVVAKGGRGGRGNQHFATPTRQAPRIAEPGTPGEERHVRLELKLLADVGLVGLPNAGKSTLLARISAARPKVADYPFTTLTPYLGVVSRDGGARSLVFADIPGLIEGAHAGAGLGHRFLRHIERCRVLLHLVDLTAPESVHRQVEVLRSELEQYDATLLTRGALLVGTKADAVSDAGRREELVAVANQLGIGAVVISAVSGAGIEGMLKAVFRLAGSR
ncbi:MAG: GTPase ObgE [Thermoanaerobaculales bacterium]